MQGNTNLCVVYDELGFTRAGGAADQVLLPAQVVHVLGSSVNLLEAALAEPAAVAWRAGRDRRRRHPGSDHRFNLVIEAAGTAGAVERALGLARRGGATRSAPPR